MPAPSVTCSICKKQVSKRQTLALPDGTRACREHPEAKSAGEQARAKQLEEMRKKAEEKTEGEVEDTTEEE